MAFDTSFPETMPAPQRSFVEFFACFTAIIDFVMTSGFSFETAFPVPIS